MNIVTLLKGKVVLAAIAGTLLVGGATVAFASTPTGQQVVNQITHHDGNTPSNHGNKQSVVSCNNGTPTAKATPDETETPEATPDKTVTPEATPDKTGTPSTNHDKDSTNHDRDTIGSGNLAEVISSLKLSTDPTSNTAKDICALHAGTFSATASDGKTVKVSKVLGYGEIAELFRYAPYLATQAKVTLSDSNITTYLANALEKCGTTAVSDCVKDAVPSPTPGAKPTQGTNDDHNNQKPQSTGTPGSDSSGKKHPDPMPTGTPVSH